MLYLLFLIWQRHSTWLVTKYLLLNKLENNGIRGKDHKSQEPLTNTWTTYPINIYRSSFKTLHPFDVPQVSVLDRLLFLLYINELLEVITHECIWFTVQIRWHRKKGFPEKNIFLGSQSKAKRTLPKVIFSQPVITF